MNKMQEMYELMVAYGVIHVPTTLIRLIDEYASEQYNAMTTHPSVETISQIIIPMILTKFPAIRIQQIRVVSHNTFVVAPLNRKAFGHSTYYYVYMEKSK